MIWSREQVIVPRWRVVTALAMVGTVIGCACLKPAPCTVYLRNDGGQSPRPYYAVEVCDGKPPRVLCDSPTPLPTPNCPTSTGEK